jgi:hypothetical protein
LTPWLTGGLGKGSNQGSSSGRPIDRSPNCSRLSRKGTRIHGGMTYLLTSHHLCSKTHGAPGLGVASADDTFGRYPSCHRDFAEISRLSRR